jgi:hypothetical protein
MPMEHITDYNTTKDKAECMLPGSSLCSVGTKHRELNTSASSRLITSNQNKSGWQLFKVVYDSFHQSLSKINALSHTDIIGWHVTSNNTTDNVSYLPV